jgi:hypothetical protein
MSQENASSMAISSSLTRLTSETRWTCSSRSREKARIYKRAVMKMGMVSVISNLRRLAEQAWLANMTGAAVRLATLDTTSTSRPLQCMRIVAISC